MKPMELFGQTATEYNGEPTGVRELAESLMREHGLDDWDLVFDRAKQRAGECRRRDRVISLSEPLMSLWTEEQRKDTILHEIAHALAPANSGHGRAWQLICIRIGADPTRTWGHNGEAVIERQKWTGTCPSGHTITRDRLTQKARRVSCSLCSRTYNPDYRFTWTQA